MSEEKPFMTESAMAEMNEEARSSVYFVGALPISVISIVVCGSLCLYAGWGWALTLFATWTAGVAAFIIPLAVRGLLDANREMTSW